MKLCCTASKPVPCFQQLQLGGKGTPDEDEPMGKLIACTMTVDRREPTGLLLCLREKLHDPRQARLQACAGTGRPCGADGHIAVLQPAVGKRLGWAAIWFKDRAVELDAFQQLHAKRHKGLRAHVSTLASASSPRMVPQSCIQTVCIHRACKPGKLDFEAKCLSTSLDLLWQP